MRLSLVTVILLSCCACLGREALCLQRSTPNASHTQGMSGSQPWREQLRAAHASAVLLDWNTGRPLATEGTEPIAVPGSILKPLLLTYALRHSIVQADTKVYCRRTLVVAGHSLPCSHPDDLPMLDAEGALALSCNTWFASLARRMASQDLQAVLQSAGLPHTSQHFADGDTRVLTALGLENVTATPLQMANAYRRLLVAEPHTSSVWKGLQGSITYGMAHNAQLRNVDILGKTGTASNPGEWWSHGWFAGAVPGRFVLVIYVPRGDGGTAATLAGNTLRQLLQDGVR